MKTRAWVLLSALPLSIIKWNERSNNWKEYQVCSSPKGFSSTYIIFTLRVRTRMYIIGSSLIASLQQEYVLPHSYWGKKLWWQLKETERDCIVTRHTAGGRCTARIDRQNACFYTHKHRHFKANLKQMYIGCGNTFTHRAFVQPLHKICRSMRTQHSKVLI